MNPSLLPLRDIHLPPPPPAWPPAPGWWLLAALALGLLVWLGRHVLRRRRARRRRRRVMEQFDRLAADDGRPAPERLAALAALLRRAARARDPRLAALTGEDWLRHLDGGDPGRPFSRGPGRALLEAPFRPALEEAELAALRPLLRRRLAELLAESANA